MQQQIRQALLVEARFGDVCDAVWRSDWLRRWRDTYPVVDRWSGEDGSYRGAILLPLWYVDLFDWDGTALVDGLFNGGNHGRTDV